MLEVSQSWSHAETFYRHAKVTPEYYTITKDLLKAIEWDLILMDSYWNWIVDHSTIVTYRYGKNPEDVLLNYHTIDKALIEVLNYYPDMDLTVVHVTDELIPIWH